MTGALGGCTEGRGTNVLVRAVAVVAAALALAGCAGEHSQMMGLGLANQAIAAPQPAPSVSESAPVPVAAGMKQTLGGKVLSAIALERVTGRKPDPSRFRELN